MDEKVQFVLVTIPFPFAKYLCGRQYFSKERACPINSRRHDLVYSTQELKVTAFVRNVLKRSIVLVIGSRLKTWVDALCELYP